MQVCVYSVKGELCEVSPDKASHSCVSALAGQPRPLQVSVRSLIRRLSRFSPYARLSMLTLEGVFGDNHAH